MSVFDDNNYGDPVSGRNAIHVLYGIIVLNLLFLLLRDDLTPWFCLIPEMFLGGDVWQIFTSLFMHANFDHFFWNMLTLFFFGPIVARTLGAKRFLILYLAAGLGGNILWLLFNWNRQAVLVGASGAVFGILLAAAMIRPNDKGFVLFFPFVPIKLRTMAIVFIAFEVYQQFFHSKGSSVAFLAHIGGFIASMCVMHFLYRGAIEWDPLAFLGGKSSGGPRIPKMPHGWSVTDDKYADPNKKHSGPVTQKELDMLLAKLSAGGINSLTPEEQERLRLARQQILEQDKR